MLTDKQKEELRAVLLAERERLGRNAIEGLRFSMDRDHRNIGRDSIDESMEEEIFSTELRLRDREKYMLDKVEHALERLENGTIDECEDCGEQISFKRLLARPITTLCIDCKEDKEKEEQFKAQLMGSASLGMDVSADAAEEE